MKHEHIIWEGRFQPIHRGHVEYVRTLQSYGKLVWIVVLQNERSSALTDSQLPVPEFSRLVDEHHRGEKNPLPFWLRYLLVVETLRAELDDWASVIVLGGRRLDLDWQFYKNALPPGRVFLTPLRDEFEDAKAKAWLSLGERVERVDVKHIPQVSGTMLRARLKAGDRVDELLLPSTQEILKKFGYWGVLTG